ncbi:MULTISPECIES: hypothetical protein [Pseudomonadota]|uniref:beta strand repeat-containing protein n=2 Tax=Pseudomonadota TaxID=1224 RepID=UPI003262DE76
MSVATTFDESFYLSNNADVVLAISQGHFSSALQHYQLFGGKSELRDPNSTFDASYYASKNPDVLTAVSNGLVANVFTHYQAFGETENRAPSSAFEGFTADAYLAANADVQAALTAGTITSALEHYIAFGQNETRSGAGVSAPTGTTFTLTTGADNFTGAATNDIFNSTQDLTAANTVGATSTLGAADQLDGGAGNDTLNIVYSGAFATNTGLPVASISNIEAINVRNATSNALTGIDLSNVSGLTSFASDRSNGNITATNAANGTAFGLIGNGTVTTAGTYSFGSVAGATAHTLNISGGMVGTAATALTGTGVLATTINSTGASNTVGTIAAAASSTSLTINATSALTTGAITAAGVTGANLTVSGTANVTTNIAAVAATAVTVSNTTGAVNLGTLNNATVTVDASANTGGVTTTLGTATTTKFTGGEGNDTLTTGAVLTTGTADGGAGTDKLVLGTNVAHANTSSLGGKYTNFETLSLNGTFDASLIAGITAIELTGATNNISKMSATQASAVTGTVDIAATTLALSDATGTADSLTLTLGTGAADATEATDTGTLTVNGFETLNLVANHGTTATTTALKTSTIAALAADSVTAINLTGGAFDFTNAATTKAVAIDGSALTAGLTIAGNLVGASTVTGSAVVDAITLGTAAGATFNLGAGNDTITGTVAQINTGANYNNINAGDGTDKLTINNGANTAVTIVDNNLSKITGVEEIVVSTSGTAAQSITTGGFFDTNFKATGVNLTTNSTTGNVTIDMTSFSGAATLAATTVGTGGGEGAINIQTGSGADTITVTAAAAGDTSVVKTFAGNDKITSAGAEATTVTGGAGDDTLVFGSSGVNTAVFENTAALNGADTITGFALTDIINWVQGGAETEVTGALTTTADVFYQLGGQAAGSADSASAAATALNAAATFTDANATAWIAISDDNSTAIYEWTDTAASANEVAAGELTLVGTIDLAMSSAQLATAITIV